MSVQAISWAFRQKTGDPGSKIVLICLANYADYDGACFPSINRLAKESEQSRRSIFYKLDDLTRLGLVIKRQMFRESGSLTSSMYYLQLHVETGEEEPVRRRTGGPDDEKDHGPN